MQGVLSSSCCGIVKPEFIKEYTKVRRDTFTPKLIATTRRRTGLYPFVFAELDCSPSRTTSTEVLYPPSSPSPPGQVESPPSTYNSSWRNWGICSPTLSPCIWSGRVVDYVSGRRRKRNKGWMKFGTGPAVFSGRVFGTRVNEAGRKRRTYVDIGEVSRSWALPYALFTLEGMVTDDR